MSSKEINANCPVCDSVDEVEYKGRLGGFAGYSDIYKCAKCNCKYAVMCMADKAMHKLIIKEDE